MFNKMYAKIKEKLKLYKKEIIFLILFALVINIRFPYYIDAPGGTLSLEERITVEDGKKINGSLNLVYVLELEATIPTLIISAFNDDWDVIKEEEVIPTNESEEDMLARGKLTLKESMNNAIVYAYKKANKKVEVKEEKVYITYVHELAKTDLKVGDQIISIEGTKINNATDIANVLNERNIGDKVSVLVKSNEKEKSKYFEVIEYEGGKKIGITLATIFEYETDQEVKFKYSNSESGSSGGFMNALYIYSSLIDEDLIKGKKIVGTGTISASGIIGEIGGIEYKIKAANKAKADIFFVPNGSNCETATKIKESKGYKLNIVCIQTFEDALDYLEKN